MYNTISIMHHRMIWSFGFCDFLSYMFICFNFTKVGFIPSKTSPTAF